MINNLLNLIGSIPTDKILHSYFGYVILDIALKVISQFTAVKPQIILLSFVVLTVLIFGKELYDKLQPDNFFDWKDVIAGYAGAVIKLILYLI